MLNKLMGISTLALYASAFDGEDSLASANPEAAAALLHTLEGRRSRAEA